jgi:YD repeat-containing protein
MCRRALEEQTGVNIDGEPVYQGIEFTRDLAGNVTSASTYVLRPQLSGPCLPQPCAMAAAAAYVPEDSLSILVDEDTTEAETMMATASLLGGGYITDVKTISYTDYDELGRVRARRGNDGQNVRYAYDENGNLTKITDSLGKITQFQYDALDRLVKTVDAKSRPTSFTYDAADRLLSVKDAALSPKTTTYAYNGLGELLKQVSPDTGTTTFVYDTSGRRASMKRADGVTTTYGYDGIGRLTSATASSKTQAFV